MPKGQKSRKIGNGGSSTSRLITATPALLPPPKPLTQPIPLVIPPHATKTLPLSSVKPEMPAPVPPPPTTKSVRGTANKRIARSAKEPETSANKKGTSSSSNTAGKGKARIPATNPSAKKTEPNNSVSNSKTTPTTNTLPNNASVEKRRNNVNRGVLRNRKLKRSGRPSNRLITSNLGRWKPLDDLSLIIDVLQTNDLRAVHHGTKFSCKFTYAEIQARWFSLLYEPAISRIAMTGMRNLHPELVKSVQRRALFSEQEEEILAAIKSVSFSTFFQSDNSKLVYFPTLAIFRNT